MDSRPSSSRLINKKADVDVHRIHTRTHQILIVWITLHQSGLCHPRRLSLFSSFWLSQQQLFIIILNRMPWPDRQTDIQGGHIKHTHTLLPVRPGKLFRSAKKIKCFSRIFSPGVLNPSNRLSFCTVQQLLAGEMMMMMVLVMMANGSADILPLHLTRMWRRWISEAERSGALLQYILIRLTKR